ncbi:hypothetical protein AJ79_00540 [Helicocarpus griseus UAMH5409]|uniref:CRIB domain-containing protein n=1 Tax=Helicocarpus griseus UAMH5409 TaxID=1447875 RepID=A0A2B7YAY9_9EURO|nr:hypothetical protein AJ79_00540 [Helicocarpus griseus UAMH5409]
MFDTISHTNKSDLSSSSSSIPPPSSSGSLWSNDLDRHRLPQMSSSTSTFPDLPAVARSRTVTQSPKRLSVFTGRSRSNTATSSSSSYKSPASSMTSVDGLSQRSSQDGRNLAQTSAPIDKEDSVAVAKSLLSRGSRMLKRQGSKFSISSTLTLDEEDEMAKAYPGSSQKLDGLGIWVRSHRARHSDTHGLKKNISDPFDFQHVTHTSPSQLPPLDNSHLNDIATEFSVIRASQRPDNELKGIRAENLHFRNFSSDDIVARINTSSRGSDSKSLHTRSPPRSPDARTSPKSPTKLGSSRNSKSVENFSRPVSRLTRQQSSPSIIPPPRSSSKLATPDIPEPSPQTIDALLGLHSTSAVPDTLYSDTHDTRLPKLDFPSVFPNVAKAITADEDKPIVARSPPAHVQTFNLADVPEEDETAARNSEVCSSPPQSSPEPFRFGQSTPRVDCDKPLPAVPSFADPVPETLGSPTIPTNRPRPREPSAAKKRESKKRYSMMLRSAADLSWEDDIDYCYEHAAESDSNFDWQRTSFEEPEMRAKLEKLAIISEDPVIDVPKENNDTEKSDKPAEPTKPAEPAAPVESQSQESQDESEQSDQTTVNGGSVSVPSPAPAKEDPIPAAVTSAPPCLETGSLPESGYFKPEQVPILSAPFGDDLSPDQTYGGLIPDDQKFEEHYPFYPRTQVDEPFDSSRGSCSPISKCNSQESIILSRAASIARKHRSSLSTTSVPELVHSSNCSHETVDRDSMSSTGDQSKQNMSTTSPVSRTPTHKRSKSLARELAQRPLPIICSTFADDYSHVSPVPTAPSHDRAKSASALDVSDSDLSMDAKAPETRKRSATITRGPSGRKVRKSYSLFPTAAAATAPASR